MHTNIFLAVAAGALIVGSTASGDEPSRSDPDVAMPIGALGSPRFADRADVADVVAGNAGQASTHYAT
jgi:hypothetical protein